LKTTIDEKEGPGRLAAAKSEYLQKDTVTPTYAGVGD